MNQDLPDVWESNQQAFDHAAVHMLRQNKRCHVPGIGCLYRGPNDTACAVGALITDDDIERYGIKNGMVGLEVGEDVPRLRRVSPGMLQDLQDLHDSEHEDTWEKCLRNHAVRWKLNTSAIDEFKKGN